MSPDGSIIAAGGWTSDRNEAGANHIYMFDRATGQLLHRFTDLPNTVVDLAFSPNGKRLAAGMGMANGIRVWSMDD